MVARVRMLDPRFRTFFGRRHAVYSVVDGLRECSNGVFVSDPVFGPDILRMVQWATIWPWEPSGAAGTGGKGSYVSLRILGT